MLLQQQERQAGEVIAVQVAEEDDIDARGIDGKAAHRDQRRRAAVEQAGGRPAGDQEAALKPTPAPERIATSENPNSHLVHALFVSAPAIERQHSRRGREWV
jgi:hypothetical protein